VEALLSPDTDDGSWDDLSACLVPFIQKMDDKYRDALMATDIAGARMQSAADQLELTLPALKSRVRRGRNQLKSALLKCCAIETVNNRMRDTSVHSPGKCDGC
jgi:RNA polymerase sigma-70 factor, ECF subfamily